MAKNTGVLSSVAVIFIGLSSTALAVALVGGEELSVYSRTRAFGESAMYTLLLLSRATEDGAFSVVAVVPAPLVVKLVPEAPWPITRSALVSPLPGVAVTVNGVLNSTTRLLR